MRFAVSRVRLCKRGALSAVVVGDGDHGPFDGAQSTGTEESDQAFASDAICRLERGREFLAAVGIHWVVVLGEQVWSACLRTNANYYPLETN